MKKTFLILALLVIAAMALAACQPAAPEPEVIVETVVVEGETVVETVVVEGEGETVIETVEVVVTEEVIVEVEVTPEPVTRQGGWLDTIIIVEEPSSDAAVTRLEAGDIDVFAYNISEPDIASRVFDSDALAYQTAYGNYNDLTFMPSTEATFSDGRLNPFYSDKIREAMNWLVDRSYIADEITGGLARPRFVPINFASKDSALLADSIAAISLKYAHNPDKAVEVITAEMEALGASLVDGKWTYNGEPVEIIGLIRVEDERLEIGDYVANLLEDIGFTVTRDYKTSAEASPCWLRGNPDDGCAHYYTGGWVSTAISRDAATNFSFFYTPDGLPFPPWQAYSPSPEFYEVATKLNNSDFATLEEREGLMRQALDLAALDSQRIWLKDDVGVAPHAANVALASDLSGSIYGSRLWSETLRFTDAAPGGSMTIAMPSIMTEPWNPLGGTNWVYDMMPMRGMQSKATVPDPFTGVNLPYVLEKAEVVVEEGLPVGTNDTDWVDLQFAPVGSIEVPADAWADWDAENQVFITAGERFTDTATVKSKVVMYYEEDYFDKMKWHDGSPVTIADHVMFMILQFDPSKEASLIYDEATVPEFQTFMDAFKGWKVVSTDPFVVEYYTDAYQLDAENNVNNIRAAHPSGYFNGVEAGWHGIVPGWLVEANGEAAFSADKAEALEVEWMSYISGPSLELLKTRLDEATEANLIPYEPTLGQFISADEASTRYANLQEWHRRYGHFWVNSGPYFLQQAFPVEGTLILQYNSEFPYMADRWSAYAAPPIPEVLLDGPDRVTIGEEAVYDVFVDLAGEPYKVDEISTGKYLVFDATGELVEVGEAVAVEDGYWQVTLSADTTGALAEGSNQLAVIVVSSRALVPVTDTLQFVTAP